MLKGIEVTGLYDVFHHPINLKEDNITLILGENGLGKTLILKMIKAFFDKNFHELYNYNFNSFILTFDDLTSITVSKSIKQDDQFLNFILSSTKKKDDKYSLKISQYDRKGRGIGRKHLGQMDLFYEDIQYRIRDFLPFRIERIASDRWIDPQSGLTSTTSELINNYKDFFPISFLKELEKGHPNWLIDKTDSINVKLIETQRLLYRIKADEGEYRSSVTKYSQELVEAIKNKTVAATDLASKLDRSYPNRVINEITTNSNISDYEIETGLNNLYKRRELLNTVGLLDTEEEDIEKITDKIKQDFATKQLLKDVLQIYLKDSNEKLTIYDDIASKLDLFIKLINKRFLYKVLSIDKKRGFVFTSLITKKDIPLTGLSSGEQHELVLFYQLLFDIEVNTLLLLDEPEISLHITWQNQFINDLRDIKKLNDFSAIIATHSPDIINKNWDLTIELDGVNVNSGTKETK